MQWLLVTLLHSTWPLLSAIPFEDEIEWRNPEELGYHFDEKGVLRDLTDNAKFKFNHYGTREADQERYEELGDIIEEHVYDLLENGQELIKATIPTDADPLEGKGFIFHSKNLDTYEKILLLVHGSGVVRAGQWSRRLIINHSLNAGTQIPYIKKARASGYGVVVLNTNQDTDSLNKETIRGSGTPLEHFLYVWKEFVLKSNVAHVAVVAHSYGGVVVTQAAAQLPSVMEKTFAVALTDSIHFGVKTKNKKDFVKWLQKKVKNWVSSDDELGSNMSIDPLDCPTVSAGTRVHELTSWNVFDPVWVFIDKQWGIFGGGKKSPEEDKLDDELEDDLMYLARREDL